jgi:hypothetical protein
MKSKALRENAKSLTIQTDKETLILEIDLIEVREFDIFGYKEGIPVCKIWIKGGALEWMMKSGRTLTTATQ